MSTSGPGSSRTRSPATKGQGGVTAEVVDGVLRVTVAGDAAFPDGSEATARVTSPDLRATDVRLERVAGDTFAGEVPVDDAGTYAAAASVADDAGAHVAGGTALTNVSYSPEYEPGEPDTALLARVSEATGGRGEIGAADVFDPDDLRAGRSRVALAGWFVLAAALLWPVAVALSRLALSGSVARSAGRAGASSLAWLRSRAPGLPGRSRAEPRRGVDRTRRHAGGPVVDDGPAEPRPDTEAAPAESLGALLASQRRRRGIVDNDPDAT